MALAFLKDKHNASKYGRAFSCTLVLIGLLATFITLDSWALLSYPTATFIPSYFYGANRSSIASRLEVVENKEGLGNVQNSSLGAGRESEAVQTAVSDGSSSPDLKSKDPVDDRANQTVSAAISSGFKNVLPEATAVSSECDLFDGQWYYDSDGPLYTNNTCPILTQSQNCQGNGRPDKDYENWRWKPSSCYLPRFNATKFFELMRGKTLAFVGDSLARNQMESLMCILWQAEVPKNIGSRRMQRWHFRSSSVTIIRIWSAWLVHQTPEPFSYIKEDVVKLHLDIPDESFMELVPTFDVLVFANGHWFPKKTVYILDNKIVGSQLFPLPKHQPVNTSTDEAFRITTETTLSALVTHPDYTGLTIVTTYSPDHYENGAWNTGGSCTGKESPLPPSDLVENNYTVVMHSKQVTAFNEAIKKVNNKSKLKLMDITKPFSFRHDGHPGPFRSPDPNKVTQRGPNGRPPPQDCLHWCMPGPVDTWNEMMLEMIRREFEGTQNNVS